MSYAFTMAFAVLSGWWDARDIRLKRDIDHSVRWAFRAMVVGIASCIALMLTDRPVWHLLPLAVGCGFLFSAVFRLSLNLWRGLDWRYVSPSSWYDWQFLRITWNPVPREELVEGWHVYMAGRPTPRAGAIAYAFELVVFALTLLV